LIAVSIVIGAPTTLAPRDRSDIRDVIEMGVADEDRVGLLDVRDGEAERPAARHAVEVGVEDEHLAAEGNLVVGIAEPAHHQGVGGSRQCRSAD